MSNQPSGPYELNPIRGVDSKSYTDFRAKNPAQTAFEQHMQETAFSEAQRAKEDAEADAKELFGDSEPQTAFQLEMQGGRTPLAADAVPTLFDPVGAEKSAKPKAPAMPSPS